MAGNFVHNLTNPNATVGTVERPWHEVRAEAFYGDIEGTAGINENIQDALDAKEPTLSKGNLTEATSSVLTITGGTAAVIGAGATIQVKKASASQDGYLAAEDYEQFSNASDLLSWVYDIDAGEWVIDADNLNPVVCLESSGA